MNDFWLLGKTQCPWQMDTTETDLALYHLYMSKENSVLIVFDFIIFLVNANTWMW